MKKYKVFTSSGISIVCAETVTRTMTIDKPVKTTFHVGDEIVAEFYAPHMVGWVELKEGAQE